jgi:hypothetical protein
MPLRIRPPKKTLSSPKRQPSDKSKRIAAMKKAQVRK